MEYLSTLKTGYQQRDLLAHLLRDARIRSGLTQVELAERLEVPQSVVSKTEAGRRRLDLVELRSFCFALNVSLMELIAEFERQIEGGNHETG